MTPSNPDNQQPLIYRIADALGVFHLVAPVNHTHCQSEVDGLETALAGKMPLKPIDSAPANNADHLVSSKGVYTALAGKSNTDHTHDHIILTGVGRLGVSEDMETRDGYVWIVLWDDAQESEVTYLIKKDDLLKWLNPDSTPTANSTKFVTSGGVKAALNVKADNVDVKYNVFTKSDESEKINLDDEFLDNHDVSHFILYNAMGDAVSISDFFESEIGNILDNNETIPYYSFAIVKVIFHDNGSTTNYFVVVEGIYQE